MCGITGIINLHEPACIPLDVLKLMISYLKHRGPDESGIYIDKWAGLGHTRLKIIDLDSGIQPIHNEDETIWIIYNGEIFNYPELRKDLLSKGHKFYTSTDTEVILHLYEEMGSSCLDFLNGQFAFAIWDSRKRELFLARDRVGILPLYYTFFKGILIFASEIKSLFMFNAIKREIDPLALDQIFTFWTTLKGRTVFQDIHELPPGHYLQVSHGNVQLQKYWQVQFYSPDQYFDFSFEETCSKLRELIYDSVRIRLRADVPIGCYLSGGLDSSLITTLVKKNFNNYLITFGIHFEENTFDESFYQKIMVSHLHTDHTNSYVTNKQIGISFPDVLWHCEKPILRTAPVPLFLLSDIVQKKGIKVVLTGEGADEIFGGYNIFRESKVKMFWSKQPESNIRPLLLQKLYPYIFENNPRAKHFIKSFFGYGLEKRDDPLFSHFIRWNNTSKIKTFFSEDIKGTIGDYNGFDDLKQTLSESYNEWDYLAKAQYLEMTIFLSNYLLSSQGDRVAMAHAVEVRPPYLDHRIIEFMARVPPKWKINVLNEKYILKETFKDTLPEKIISRQKHPYRAPIKECLLNEDALYTKEILSDNFLNESKLFNISKVERLLKKLKVSKTVSEVDNMALAGILSSQIIYEQFIKNFPKYSIYPVYPDFFINKA